MEIEHSLVVGGELWEEDTLRDNKYISSCTDNLTLNDESCHRILLTPPPDQARPAGEVWKSDEGQLVSHKPPVVQCLKNMVRESRLSPDWSRQEVDVEAVGSYWDHELVLDETLDWSSKTDHIYMKGQIDHMY